MEVVEQQKTSSNLRKNVYVNAAPITTGSEDERSAIQPNNSRNIQANNQRTTRYLVKNISKKIGLN